MHGLRSLSSTLTSIETRGGGINILPSSEPRGGAPGLWRWLSVPILLLLFVLLRGPSAGAPSLRAPHMLSHTPGPGWELVSVQATFRHGARTPLSEMYWADMEFKDCQQQYQGVTIELKDENGSGSPPPLLDLKQPLLPGGCRMGQLTGVGYGMARDLGIWLRQRYMLELDLLSTSMKPEEFGLRTTCIQRAMQTLQGVMTGLTSASASAPRTFTANASLETREIEYGNNVTCPALGPRHASLQALIADRDAKDPTLAKHAIQVASALNLTLPLDWLRLHDSMCSILAAKGVAPPRHLSSDLKKIISAQAVHIEGDRLGPVPAHGLLPAPACVETVKWEVGLLIARILNTLQMAAAHTRTTNSKPNSSSSSLPSSSSTFAPPPMVLYSGHDSTITPLLAALGNPETAWPPFTASLVFELWVKPNSEGTQEEQTGTAAGGIGDNKSNRRSSRRIQEATEERTSSSMKEPFALFKDSKEKHSWFPMAARGGWGGWGSDSLFSLRGGGRRLKAEVAKKAEGQDSTAVLSRKGGGKGQTTLAPSTLVRVLYNRRPMQLTIPNEQSASGTWTSLEDFTRLLQPYASDPEAHSRECAVKT